MKPENSLRNALSAGVIAAMFGAGAAHAELDTVTFEVILGNHTDPWTTEHHAPFFTERLPELSGGKITARVNPYTQLGLGGYEIMDLLKLGSNDISWVTVGYLGGAAPITEGLELPGLTGDYNIQFKLQDAYRELFDRTLQETYNSKLIFWSPQPALQAYCNLTDAEAANFSLDVMKGKKIRVHSTPFSDFVEGMGGTPITMPFTDVVPALERGVIDCAMTTWPPAYGYKFGQVARHTILLNAGFSNHSFAMNLDTWNGLNAETQAFLTEQFDKLQSEVREFSSQMATDEIGCLGDGPCTWGEPAGTTLVNLSEADEAKMKQIIQDVVLPRWAERCGTDCANQWNAISSELLGMSIKTN